MTDGLFELPSTPPPDCTPGERRRARLVRAVENGQHPLATVWPSMSLPLHTEAMRALDASKTVIRCGTCSHRVIQTYHNSRYPKCHAGEGIRVSHSDATDVRASWPGCRDWNPSVQS